MSVIDPAQQEANIETLKGELRSRSTKPEIIHGGFSERQAGIALALDHDRLLRIIHHQQHLLNNAQRYIVLAQGYVNLQNMEDCPQTGLVILTDETNIDVGHWDDKLKIWVSQTGKFNKKYQPTGWSLIGQSVQNPLEYRAALAKGAENAKSIN